MCRVVLSRTDLSVLRKLGTAIRQPALFVNGMSLDMHELHVSSHRLREDALRSRFRPLDANPLCFAVRASAPPQSAADTIGLQDS